MCVCVCVCVLASTVNVVGQQWIASPSLHRQLRQTRSLPHPTPLSGDQPGGNHGLHRLCWSTDASWGYTHTHSHAGAVAQTHTHKRKKKVYCKIRSCTAYIWYQIDKNIWARASVQYPVSAVVSCELLDYLLIDRAVAKSSSSVLHLQSEQEDVRKLEVQRFQENAKCASTHISHLLYVLQRETCQLQFVPTPAADAEKSSQQWHY